MQNSKFSGINQITKAEIKKSILDYFPKESQRGGKRKLMLFHKVTNLRELIDFCIEDYGAWKDAVLMGAGAYLKIGMYSTEIAAAKKYIREKVYGYLTGSPASTPEEYDAWHKEICLTLSNAQKNFQEYSISRRTSQDKFKNKSGFTVGNAQKFLNMLMKDLYACLSQDSCFLKDYENYFTYCHMPLDSYILRFIDDIRNREGIKKVSRIWSWSNLTSYDSYMDEQRDIREYVNKYNSNATVLQVEFMVWQLYK